jgi:hypothetical protein
MLMTIRYVTLASQPCFRRYPGRPDKIVRAKRSEQRGCEQ